MNHWRVESVSLYGADYNIATNPVRNMKYCVLNNRDVATVQLFVILGNKIHRGKIYSLLSLTDS
jgi:hypothetical protein